MAAFDDDGPLHGPCETCEGSGYTASNQEEKISTASYICPNCGAESFNRNDVRERYCGACHVFEEDAA
jgi:ribosomal protein S27AE